MQKTSEIKKVKFKDWINKTGPYKVAELLKVNPSCVRHWRTGRAIPRTKQMLAILKLSKGAVNPKEIFKTHSNYWAAK